MYLIEWGLWRMSIESPKQRQATDAERSARDLQADKDFYESDFFEDSHFHIASSKPNTRGPIFAFNDTYMDMRCGGSEEKRGLITLATLGGVAPAIYTGLHMTLSSLYVDLFGHLPLTFTSFALTVLSGLIDATVIYFYLRYGLQFTRLEMLTTRHLLIRFNRKTQQVHLHRPSHSGGIVTFPWKSTRSIATRPEDDSTSVGLRLALIWHPSQTGLPQMEMALVGKQGQGGSELRDEWEFIRRYMEEGPENLPRPRLSTQFPSPIRAFSAQFEGVGRFFRNSSWLFKFALLFLWPAFVIIGTAHWLSLMLCWRPRWPKVIREAGQPGKPVPPLTTLADYPPKIQERLLANADRWELKPGKRPEKKPRKPRKSRAKPKEQTE